MVTLIEPEDDSGFRLDHFQEGVTVARAVWRDRRDGSEHMRETTEETKALALLDWIGQHPRMELVSFEVS
jgi:hypothetical protein